MFGSFLNVCIARLPKHLSIVTPRSYCPVCSEPIRALDNIPVASWIWLKRKCRQCHTRISIQYPLIELGTAVLFVACLIETGFSWETLINAVACFFLLGLAVMDAQTMILPDTFTLTGLVVAFVLKVCEPGIGLGLEQRARIAFRTIEDAALAAGMLLLVWAVYWVMR
ncbi:MAG: prepilin peptidase, partial [Ktedonobacteraceae bacterium]|nr:prepilin peptidase [Ktedonobacteraceae bacterium]